MVCHLPKQDDISPELMADIINESADNGYHAIMEEALDKNIRAKGKIEKILSVKGTESYIIAGSEHQIWAINPRNRQQLRIKLAKDNSKILDMHAGNLGIYHASEERKELFKEIWRSSSLNIRNSPKERYLKPYDINFVQIYDSISGKSILTIAPKGSEKLPLEDRLVALDFKFHKKGNSLGYNLNGSEGTIFYNCAGYDLEQSGKTIAEGNKIYVDGKKIATLGEDIKYMGEVDAVQFERTFRMKSKERYKRNKGFFK